MASAEDQIIHHLKDTVGLARADELGVSGGEPVLDEGCAAVYRIGVPLVSTR